MAFVTGTKWIGSDPPPEIAKVHQLIWPAPGLDDTCLS